MKDPKLVALVEKQTDDFINGASEAQRIENFKKIQEYQKERKEYDR